MILIQQLGELVEDVQADMTKGQGGTDTTLFVKTQTGLGTAIAATNLTLVDKTFTQTNISASHVMSVSVGNSNTLVEFEVNNGVISYNRTIRADFDKTSAIELTIFQSFDFELIV